MSAKDNKYDSLGATHKKNSRNERRKNVQARFYLSTNLLVACRHCATPEHFVALHKLLRAARCVNSYPSQCSTTTITDRIRHQPLRLRIQTVLLKGTLCVRKDLFLEIGDPL